MCPWAFRMGESNIYIKLIFQALAFDNHCCFIEDSKLNNFCCFHMLCYDILISDWELKGVELIEQLSDNSVTMGNEGLMVVTVTDRYGDIKNGSVCSFNFDWWKANLFCRFLGYETGRWGSYPRNFKYVSEWVFSTSIADWCSISINDWCSGI